MLTTPYQEWKPPKELKEYIDCIWTLQLPPQIKTVIIIPDGCIDLIFDLQRQTSFWSGTMTKAARFSLSPKQNLIGIRFKSGMARAFISCPLSELVNQNIQSNELKFKDDILMENLLFINHTVESRVSFIFKWLIINVSLFPKNKIIPQVFSKTNTQGSLKISDIAMQLGITRQYLARNFREYIGVEPKSFYRTLRIQSFIKNLPWENMRQVNWTQRALDFGFYDQSHLIHECQDILGLTPLAITKEKFLFN